MLSKGIKEQILNTLYGFRIRVSDQLKMQGSNNIYKRGLELYESI